MKRLLYGMGFGAGLALSAAGGYQALHAAPSETRAALTQEPTTYRDVVKRVLPAVVSIEAKVKPKVQATAGQLPPGAFEGMPEDFRKFFERMPKQPMPDQAPGHAMGSGFVTDASGVIVTNEHVVRGADEVEIHFQDGRTLKSKEIFRDAKTDLAIIRVETKEPLPALKLGNSTEMEVGDRVIAVGAPLGLTGTVTQGIVSAKGRDINMNMYEDFIQTDAAINPGNSGGPLLNLKGEVIGINSAIKSGTGGFQGIGLAISSNLAKNVMDQLLKGGSVHRGYLGVQVSPLNEEVASRLGVTGKAGVVIGKVTPGSPAEKAGLQDGDVLTDLAGAPVKNPRQLQQAVAGLTIGKSVELGIVRDGARKTLSMTVEEQPESFGAANEPTSPSANKLDKLGLAFSDLTAEKAKTLGYADNAEGVLVTEVDPNGAAAKAGLRPGVLIQKADGQKVKTAAELKKAIDAGSLEKGVLFQVRTPQVGTSYVLLKAAK